MLTIRKFAQIFVSILVILTVMVNGFIYTPVQAQSQDGVKREVNADTGRVSFIGPENGSAVPAISALGLAPSVDRPVDPARALLQRFAPEFGLTNSNRDLVERTNRHMDNGRLVARYQQNYQGIPVLAGELIVNTNENGDLYSISGEVSPELSVPTQPTIDAEQARQAALRAVQRWHFETPAEFGSTDPELWVYDESLLFPSTRPPELVWRMEVTPTSNNLPIRELVLVNAQTGIISQHFNQMDSAWQSPTSDIATSNSYTAPIMTNAARASTHLLLTASVQTYTAGNSTSLPGTFLCDQSQPNCTNGVNPHADAAHIYALGTYDLYLNKHGRNSLDNAGMLIKSTVHYDTAYGNAYWDSNALQMVYGDGFGFPLADDIVAHELTHGVTDHESELLYLYQSGAINESFSDLWGEYYDQTNGLGNDDPSVKWLLGEDTEGLGAVRSMKNPPAFGDPDKMTSSLYYKGEGGNGGVHWNSGVNNKAVYLMVDGGTFNGKTVSGIGWDKTAAIYYEVQTNLLGSGSNYSDLYYAVQQACTTLTGGAQGITLDDCINVKNALDAVQMNTPILLKSQITAPLCPAGMAPSTTFLFEDKMEGALTNNWYADGYWSLSTDIANSPSHSMYGNAINTYIYQTTTMKNGVVVQPNTYLHFDHAYDFEFAGPYYYDGGVVEYSTNNGYSWQDAGPLFSAGANYSGTIVPYYYFSNWLGGRKAFVGTTYPYDSEPTSLVSTRYNLNSLAGQQVQFRFAYATDDYLDYPFKGWHIDDVKIYTCLGIPVIPVLQTPLNSALITDYTPTLNWADSIPAIDRYHLQISTNSAFTALLYDENNLAGSEFTVPADLNENTTYYWRVRAFNAEDVTNNWSLVRTFRTVLKPPILVSPLDLSNPLTLRPTFTWTNPNVGTAPTNYTIQISPASNFSTVVNTGTVTGTSYIPAVNLPSNKQLYWRVRANGSNGPSAFSSPVMSFQTPLTAPPVPVLTAPALGVLTTDYTPTFTWATGILPVGTTIDHFQIQVDNNSDFSNPEIDTTAGTATNFTPGSDLTSNTKFYWRVRTYNNLLEFSPWSAVRNVRTALTPPTLVSPDNTLAPALSVLRPTFTWNAVPTATGYTLQVSKFANFSTILVTYSPTTASFTPTVDLPKNTDLYWRVLTRGVNGPSVPSEAYVFHTPTNPPAVPTLLLPATGVLTTDYTPTFTWAMPATSPAYDHFIVQADNNSDFSSPEVNETAVASSPFTPITDLASNTRFYWRVRAVNVTGEMGNWSAVRNIRTALIPPTLVSPDNTLTPALSVLRPTFTWNAVPTATGYTLQVSKFANFSTILVTYSPTTASFTPTVDLPKNTDLYWRVLTRGVNGPSVPSEAYVFHTPTNPPAVPTLLLPATGVLTTDYTPTFTWAMPATSPAYDHFIVQADNNSDFGSPEVNETAVVSSPFTPSSDLAVNTKFYWRVRAVNATGDMGNWSAVRYLRTALPTPILTAPFDLAFLSTLYPVFNWDDVPGASGYIIQVSISPNFTSFIVNATTVSSQYPVYKALPSGKILYWRVRATGSNGSPTGWSGTFVFYTP